MKDDKYGLILFSLSVAIFIAGAAAKLSSPLVEWDHVSILQAASWAEGGKFFARDQPPLYSFLLSFFSGTPASITVFRCLNLLAAGLTALLLYGFSRKYMERGLSLAAAAFYLLTPAVIQGTSVLDYADTSWLPLVSLLLLKLSSSLSGRFSITGFLAVAAAAGLCLSFKVTSAIALLLPFPMYWLAGGKEVKKSFFPVLAAVAAGTLIFVLGWKMAAPHLFSGEGTWDFYVNAKSTVLERLFPAFSLEFAGKWLACLAAMLFWFSPFLLAMWIGSVLKRRGYAEAAAPADIRFFSFVGLFYFVGYFLIGGLNHGYPRYHMAIWPVIVFLAVFGCREALRGFLEKDVFRTSAIACLAALPGVLFLPDPLRLLNLGLKEAMIAGFGIAAVAAGLAAVLAFYLFLIWLSSCHKRGAVFAPFMTAVLAFYLITDLSQMRARYMTSGEYGTAGKAKLAAELRASVPAGAAIFATLGLLYYIRPGSSAEFGMGDWSSAGHIKSLMTGRFPEVVVLGAGCNTLWQFRLFLSDPELTAFLNERYIPGKVGTFRVWRKKTPMGKT